MLYFLSFLLGALFCYLLFRETSEYSKDIPGKFHIIQTLEDGSEKCMGWFIPEHQTHYVTDYCPNSRREKTNYKPKSKPQ